MYKDNLIKLKRFTLKNKILDYNRELLYKMNIGFYKNNVKFYRNEDLVTNVKRKKLLEKSGYFRTMFKNCYKHHKSEEIDVYFPGKDEIVDKVIHFISSDSVTIDILSIFEFYHLAVFLQIESLQQICLDHFTLNLNRKTLQLQLDLITKCSYLDKNFEERSVLFRDSGSPSFSGLYFFQQNEKRSTCLKIKSKHFNSLNELYQFRESETLSSLHYFDNMLCSISYDDFETAFYCFSMMFYQEKLTTMCLTVLITLKTASRQFVLIAKAFIFLASWKINTKNIF